jgi:O-antigen/teichoic acid export membrane protein
MAGSMGANVGSYLYHLVMGRLLGPTGYGELSSLLSIFYIFTVPLNVGAIVLVKFISSMKAQNQLGQVQTLIVKVTKACLIGCIVALPVIILASPFISTFLHIQSSVLFIFVYIIFILSLLTVIVSSALQGYQKFLWVSILGAGSVVLKLLLSIPAVHFGIYGVLLATIGSTLVVYLLYFLPLQFIFKVKSSNLTFTAREAMRYAVPSLLIILGMTSLYSTDMILVRHFFSAHEAGLYASLTVLGKIIFYASSAVSIVIFPVLSERTAKGEKGTKLIFIGLGTVTAVSAGITLFYFAFPEFIIRTFFGSSYIQGAPLLGLFGIFLVLYSIGNMFTTIFMALGKLKIWYVPVICALIQIVGINVYHDSVMSVIWVNIVTSLVLVVSFLGYYMKRIYEKV